MVTSPDPAPTSATTRVTAQVEELHQPGDFFDQTRVLLFDLGGLGPGERQRQNGDKGWKHSSISWMMVHPTTMRLRSRPLGWKATDAVALGETPCIVFA